MLTDILTEIKHFFVLSQHEGEWVMTDGQVTLDGIAPKVGQYLAIKSDLNAAVVMVSEVNGSVLRLTSDVQLVDDTITRLALLSVPPSLVTIADRIRAYSDKQGDSILVSEKFAGWSGTKAQGKAGALTWQEKFADALRPYRRMFADWGWD